MTSLKWKEVGFFVCSQLGTKIQEGTKHGKDKNVHRCGSYMGEVINIYLWLITYNWLIFLYEREREREYNSEILAISAIA